MRKLSTEEIVDILRAASDLCRHDLRHPEPITVAAGGFLGEVDAPFAYDQICVAVWSVNKESDESIHGYGDGRWIAMLEMAARIEERARGGAS